MKKKNKDFISQDSEYLYHTGGELFPRPTLAHTVFRWKAIDRVIHFFNSLTQVINLLITKLKSQKMRTLVRICGCYGQA